MIKLTIQIDQPLLIGRRATVTLTDIDADGVRVVVKGQVVGGPDDGQRVNEAHEIGRGQSVHMGPNIAVTLIAARGDSATLGVLAPPHMPVQAMPSPGQARPRQPPRTAGEFDD